MGRPTGKAKRKMTRGKTLRWVAALAGATLIATVAYAALRFGNAVNIGRAPNTEGRGPGVHIDFQAPPGGEEIRAAAAEVAEDTPEGQLVLAARNGEVERVGELLATGLPPDAQETKNGHRALHQAAGAGQVAAMDLLLTAGADPRGRDGSGYTALMRAADAAHLEAGQLLLDAGAAVNARLETGTTAVGQGETALMQVVAGSFFRYLDAGGDEPDAEQKAAELEFARMLFDAGADPNLHSEKDGSPLKVLAVTQRADLLTLFIENGARTDGDAELAILGMMPGPIGEALRSAQSAASESPTADDPR